MQTQSLMERLKEDTRKAHDSAEGSKLQAELGSGSIALETYRDYLGQLYLIHKALETGIKRNLQLQALNRTLTTDHFQEEVLAKDLKAIGVDCSSIQPLQSTKELIDSIEEHSKSCPPALLGYHYVLLGSKHGGKYLAKRLQDQFQFQDGIGCRYFDPFGQTFMPLWLEFKNSMNENIEDENQQAQIVRAARAMFSGIERICLEIYV